MNIAERIVTRAMVQNSSLRTKTAVHQKIWRKFIKRLAKHGDDIRWIQFS